MRIPVSEIVGAFLDEMNLGASEYAKAYALAIRGWRELNWDIVGSTKEIRLKVCGDKTVKLPNDYISESFVGVPRSEFEHSGSCDGGAVALTRATNLATVDYPIHRFQGNNVAGSSLNNFQEGSGTLSGSLGVGSYTVVGYFYIDKSQRVIRLSQDLPYSEVILQYLSYTNDECEYEIDELASEALIAYIRWRWSHTSSRVGLGTITYYRNEYYNERTKAKARIKKLTLQDMNRSARMSVKQGLKS